MADIKRLNYFTNEFLEAADFTAEQKYHLDMRHLHNSSLHTPGVVNGLVVSLSGAQVTVTPGMAIDPSGQEIVMSAPQSVQKPATGSFFVTLKYHEDQTDQTTRGGVTGFKRVAENPNVLPEVPTTPDSSAVILAFFDANGNPDPSKRQWASSVLAPNSVTGDKIADGSVGAAELANNAVTPPALRDGAVTLGKLALTPRPDPSVPYTQLTLQPGAFADVAVAPGFNITNTRPGVLLLVIVDAYTVTNGGIVGWQRISDTGKDGTVVNERVRFQNLSLAPSGGGAPPIITVNYKIYVVRL